MTMTNLNVRVDEDIKRKAEQICQELGLNLSTAVNIFLRQTVRSEGIPFEVRLDRPNAETIAAMREADAILSGRTKAKAYHSPQELFDELDAEPDEADV